METSNTVHLEAATLLLIMFFCLTTWACARQSAAPPPPASPPGPSAYAAPPPPPPPAPCGGVALGGPPPPPPPALLAPPARGTETTMTGVVRNFNYGPDGAVNGVILGQGVVVFFPPDQSAEVTRIAPISGRVRVRGLLRAGTAGIRILDAEVITSPRTGVSVNVAPPAPQAGPPPAGAP